MKTLFLVLLLHTSIDYVATVPKPTEVAITSIKKSKGKGKGSKPYFARFM